MSDALDEESQAALSLAAKRLQELDLSVPARPLTRLMIGALRRRNTEQIRGSVGRWRLDLRQIDDVLSGVEATVEAAEKKAAVAEPFGPIWWRLRIEDLTRRQQSGSPSATHQWAAVWLQGVVGERWERCDEVLGLPGGGEVEQQLADPMAKLTTALRNSEIWNVPGAAGELLDFGPEILGKDTWVKLAVLRARALVYWFADYEAAWRVAQKAVAQSRSQLIDKVAWLESLALAVSAEVLIEQRDLKPAEELLRRPLKSEEPTPDIHIAAALLAMAQDLPDRANDLYDEAVAASALPTAQSEQVILARPQLLRPVPGNLLWRLSQCTDDAAAALDLLQRALDQGIRGVGAAPEAEALTEKAKLLKRLGSPEAGAAYYAAGVAFSGSGSPGRARALLKKACQLSPDVAEHHWSYADALREHAVDVDEVVSPDVLQDAGTHLAAGFEIRRPTNSEAWVLLSAALVAYYQRQLGHDGEDPSLLCERALLLDPQNQAAHGFLATFLRVAGLPRQALATAAQGQQQGYGHPFTAARQAGAYLDLGQYQAALNIATKALTDWPGQTELVVHRALALIRLERYEQALSTLNGEDERLTYLRAGCLVLLGDLPGARAEARATWVDRTQLSSKAVSAWAAFQSGELDDAIAIQRDLVDRAPRDASFRRDLGQMLLMRGSDDADLAEGTESLRGGIIAAPTAHELVHMTTMEFEALRKTLPSGRSLPELTELTELAADRIAALRSGTRHIDDPAEIAARARTAMADRDPVTALDLYERLCRRHDVPEARLGLARAARAILDRGDRAVHDANDLALAAENWRRLPDILPLLDGGSQIRTDLAGRLAFAEVELAGRRLPTDIALLARSPGPDSPSVLDDVFQVFARDVPSWWRHRQALLERSAEPGDRAATRDITRVIDRLPLDDVYRLRRDAVHGSDMLPFVSPIEVRLDAGHAHLRHNEDVATAIGGLRSKLIEEMGVQLPGVRVEPNSPGSTSTAILLYDQVVAERQLPADPAAAVVELLSVGEQAIRAQLYRLLIVDDIPLWLRRWDPTGALENGREPPTPDARLRLARVLRLLLRERVPVIDRDAILAGWREAEKSPQCHGPMDALRVVRRRLGAERLGRERDSDPVRLPRELEQRAERGLASADSWAWSMERDQAIELMADLRRWLAGQSSTSGVVAIAVGNFRLRPFVWRMLATEATRVRVLAEEELS
ncbi:tetratricopeptide repeat protein [Kribbella sp. NPDC051936]|uniref:tetratricopeptide repeat protein n=1 Tax=Kribbella sp. NPDC051936 TaxID=3154946 RepID=UPI00341E695A